MTYILVGVALLAALFCFIESRLRAARATTLAAHRAARRRRRRSTVTKGRAELRLLRPSEDGERRRAHG